MWFKSPPAGIAAVCFAESAQVHSIAFPEVGLQHFFNDVFRHAFLLDKGSG
jgi:hypothetical protein